jgi:ABC-type sugar transport system ATPase subunit
MRHVRARCSAVVLRSPRSAVIAEIRQLTIQYGKRTAVDALDLSLDAGEIALLLGLCAGTPN